MDFISMGQRIKNERRKQSLTQEKLAEIIGVTRNHISLIEKGDRAAGIEVLEKISNCFNVSIDYLVKGDQLVFYKSAISEFEQFMKEICTKEDISRAVELIKSEIRNICEKE